MPGLRTRKAPRRINLALQGGGALGAFTWGVLDRLLDEAHIRFDTVSGASAGAMNAVVLASGLAAGGRSEAKAALGAFWTEVGRAGRLSGAGLAPGTLMAAFGAFLSPYQTNPLNLDPLRRILTDLVDFERLAKASPVRLVVSATNLRTEKTRLFDETSLGIDAVLASACLPMLHHAVWIDGDPYWDGGFSANPPVLPVLKRSQADETLLVRLIEVGSDTPPARVPEITAHVHRLAFNRPLTDELDRLALFARMGKELGGNAPALLRRAARHRLSEIDAARHLDQRLRAQAVRPSPDVIGALFSRGRAAAGAWLDEISPDSQAVAAPA